MTIHWQKHTLSEVIKFYTDNFTPQPGQKITHVEYYIDSAKGIVIFQLFVDEPSTKKKDSK